MPTTRRVLAWWLALALSAGLVAAVLDGAVLVVTPGVRFVTVVAVMLTDLGLSLVVAAPLAPLATGLEERPRLGLLAVFLLATTVAWSITDPLSRRLSLVYVGVVGLCAILTTVCVALARLPNRTLAVWLAVGGIGVGAIAADLMVSASIYPELHAVLHLVAVGAAAALGRRYVHDGVMKASQRQLLLFTIPLLLITGIHLLTADAWASQWRSQAATRARYLASLTRALHAIDLDGDGHSALAWGADCDDFDGDVHALAPDPPGNGDSNCNGVDAPADPTPAQLGLAPAFGTPDLSAAPVDMFVLVTIDTLRADCLDFDHMPRMAALAERGLRMDRMVAAGSTTFVSIPLMFKPTDTAPAVTERLRRRGVAITAVGNGAPGLDYPSMGFTGLDRTKTCDAAVGKALDAIDRVGDRPHLLWLYCLEPHAPYAPQEPAQPAKAAGCGGAPEDPKTLRYRGEVAATDAAVGRLIDGLRNRGRMERSAVLVTSDHGEAFGENGVWTHARSGIDPVLRVPGLLVGPGVSKAVHRGLTTHRDIPATLSGAFGMLEPADERFGRSWWRLPAAPDKPLHDFVVARSALYSSGAKPYRSLLVLIEDRYKLVAAVEDRTVSLFDMVRDPGEGRDIAGEAADLVQELQRKLALYADVDGYVGWQH